VVGKAEDFMEAPDSGIVQYIEGRTKLFVPRESLIRESKAGTPAFFNPHAALGRDIAICVTSKFCERLAQTSTFVDVLAGVGARALRILVEGDHVDEAIINDVNPVALQLAERSADANMVRGRCHFTNLEAASLLVSRPSFKTRFTVVDVDPFGSPAPFFEAAVRGVRDEGMLAFTATDTAALCGLYPQVAFRRYHGYSLKVEEAKEIGLRLLLGGAAFAAMRLECGVEPLISHVSRHYMRVYLQLHLGATHATRTAEQIGHYVHCPHCLSRYTTISFERRCRVCGGEALTAGPLWIGQLASESFVKEVAEYARAKQFTGAYRVLQAIGLECTMPPGFYALDALCSRLRISTPPLSALIDRLTQLGFRVTRTHMAPLGIKTDAEPKILTETIHELASSPLKPKHTK